MNFILWVTLIFVSSASRNHGKENVSFPRQKDNFEILRMIPVIDEDLSYVTLITTQRLFDFRETQNEVSSPYANNECGITYAGNVKSGRNTEVEDHPWQVFLRIQTKNDSNSYACEGSLISEQHVLTAAHCISGLGEISKIIVTLGRVEMNSNLEKSGVQVDSIRWKTHPQWEKEGLDHDIGIITIHSIASNEPATWMPVCLPTKTTKDVEVPCITSGLFGKTSDNEGDKSKRRLKLIRAKTLDNEECKRRSAFMSMYLKPSMICIGGEIGRETICSGNSGGPLVTQESGRYVQIGITSFGGTEFCEMSGTSAFTRVKHYMEFICTETGICQ